MFGYILLLNLFVLIIHWLNDELTVSLVTCSNVKFEFLPYENLAYFRQNPCLETGLNVDYPRKFSSIFPFSFQPREIEKS